MLSNPPRQGKRKMDPAEARTTFSFHGLTEVCVSKTPSTPKASAERNSVPRLPGSWSSQPTSSMDEHCSSVSSWMDGILARANNPCGCSVLTMVGNKSIRNLYDLGLAGNPIRSDPGFWIASTALGHIHLVDEEVASDGFADQLGALDSDSALRVRPAIPQCSTQLLQSRSWKQK